MSARIKIRGRRELFEADSVTLTGGFITATGRWSRRTGANYADITRSPLARKTWPARQVVEITWSDDERGVA